MSILKASFRVHSVLQNIYPPSYYVDVAQNRLISHPLYNKPLYKIHRIAILSYSFGFFLPALFLRLYWLFVHKDTYTYKHGAEGLMYVFGFFALLILAYNNFLVVSRGSELICLVNMVSLLVPEKLGHGKKFKLRECTKKEIFIYYFTSLFLMIDLTFLVLPFAVPFEPFQLAFGSSISVKIFASVNFFLIASYINWYTLSSLILILGALDGAMCFSDALFDKSIAGLQTSYKFYRSLSKYKMTSLTFTIGLDAIADLPAFLLCIGVIYTAFSAAAAFLMYGKISTLCWLILPSMTFICVSAFLIFTYLAAIPYNNSIEFRQYWKGQVTKRLDKRLLKACKEFGVLVGPYGICDKEMGIRISDDIFQNTVNALLTFNM